MRPLRETTTTTIDSRCRLAQDEYFAGGQDDQGGGSATVLLYPKYDKEEDGEAAKNETAAAPVQPEKFVGEGRKL